MNSTSTRDTRATDGRMRAAVIVRPGGPEVFEIREVSRPQASGDRALIRVLAAGVNRADIPITV